MSEKEEERIIRAFSVSKELSKKLINPDTGEVLYFIDRDFGLKRGLQSVMDFRNPLTIDPNMVRIRIKLNRI
jgi:hypothetical protein